MLAMATLSSGPTTAMVYESFVATSIWLKKALTCQNSIASQAVGENTAKMKNMLDGICVKTMVFNNPILLANLAATPMEMAVRTWDKKNTGPSSHGFRSNLAMNQAAIKLWCTIDVLKVSTVNSPVRVNIRRREGSFRGLIHCC